MSARPGVIILAAAALLLFAGFGAREEVPVILGLLMGGAGLASLIGAAASNRKLPPADSSLIESRFQQIEKRLQVTEDELAAATREVASLRETREFDRQLLETRKPAIPPADPDRSAST
ncbi:MAG: hypothetical protein PVH00_03775 [Gemmatimonadota bacterium]|jgi:hypothetical protein